LTTFDRSDHDLATSPLRCPAKPVLLALKPRVLGVLIDVLPANARLLVLPDSLEFSPEQQEIMSMC